MCTVTFIPLQDKVFITSNRDEHFTRKPALLPMVYKFESGRMVYPKDGDAGGTWIAMHNNGNAMVLMNGAFKRHKVQRPYRKSRGVVFLDIFDAISPVERFDHADLVGIEPFTLVAWVKHSLWEMRWDGTEKYILAVVATQPAMWCSATLYDEAVIEKRRAWFYKWLQENPYPNGEEIRRFHEFAGDGDSNNDLRMNRDGILKTVSITGMELSVENAVMHYKDLDSGMQNINQWIFANNQYS
jgi:uncharacterized protein with NRDE domain